MELKQKVLLFLHVGVGRDVERYERVSMQSWGNTNRNKTEEKGNVRGKKYLSLKFHHEENDKLD